MENISNSSFVPSNLPPRSIDNKSISASKEIIEERVNSLASPTLEKISLKNETKQHPSQIQRPKIGEFVETPENIFDEISDQVGQSESSLSLKTLKPTVSLDKANQIGVNLKDAEEIINEFALMQKEAFLQEHGSEALMDKNELEVLKAWLGSPERMDRNNKPRVEIRLVPNTFPAVVANIALSFPDTETRNSMFEGLKKRFSELSLVSAGTTTVEIGTKDVDKATTINYIANHFEELLKQMRYEPGGLIDANVNHTVIIADADGTLWDPPVRDKPPEATNLENSPARASILNYLRAGGVLVVNSGNDPRRTVNRILKGIPELERKELLSRIAVAAAGGHTLMTLDSEGHIHEVPGYREQALKEQQEKPVRPSEHLDVLYIGDDGRVKGNDFPAFLKVGPGHYICVHNKEKQSELDESLKTATVVGEAKAVADIFSAVVDKAIIHYQKDKKMNISPPLFEDIPSYVSLASSIPDAKDLMNRSLKLCGGRKGVDQLIVSNDQLNGPVRYEREEIDQSLNTFDKAIHQNFTLSEQPQIKYVDGQSIGEKTKVKLNFEGLMSLSDSFSTALEAEGTKAKSLYNHFDQVDGTSFEGFMQNALDRMDLKDGDTIRLLEPGNNDQATPMFVAQQIKFIQDYANKRSVGESPFKLSIQVLVMGRGGHATTATFPQIGELKGPVFSGVAEAESLGGTLMEALHQLGINSLVVDKFDPSHFGNVQIKLAKTSTNTGENVKEALDSDPSGNRPPHVFVCAARTASTRQALTFAQQYAANSKDPLSKKAYESITSIPYGRSEEFIHGALSDHQAVTEMYMGLAEQCRSFYYGFNPDGAFIPPSPIDASKLENLYKAYDLLSGTNNLEESKKKDIRDLLNFFGKCCLTMEKSITISKESDFQKLATDRSVKLLMQRKGIKDDMMAAWNNFKSLRAKDKLLTQDQKRLLHIYSELFQKMQASKQNDRTVLACSIAMAQLGKRFASILQDLKSKS